MSIVHQALFEVLEIRVGNTIDVKLQTSWNLHLRRSALVQGHVGAGKGKGNSSLGFFTVLKNHLEH